MLKKDINFEALREALENEKYYMSEEAAAVLECFLNRVVESVEDDENVDLTSDIYYEIDEYFIYYSDAWQYLQNQQITDFKEAIAEGHDSLLGFACYYLTDEVFEKMPQELRDLIY